MNKKLQYEKPQLRKVRLDVQTSVLSVCRTSLVATGQSTNMCVIAGNKTCYTPPTVTGFFPEG